MIPNKLDTQEAEVIATMACKERQTITCNQFHFTLPKKPGSWDQTLEKKITMPLTQQWTHSSRKISAKNFQAQRNFTIRPTESCLQSTMNFSSQTSSRPHCILSALLNQTKWNICSDYLPSNLWLTHLCSSTKHQRVWIFSFGMMPQVPLKWQSSQSLRLLLNMASPKTVDSFLSTDVEMPQDGEVMKYENIW